MSGWYDDWVYGKVTLYTAFFGWLDGDKSPSEVADDKCGFRTDSYGSKCHNEVEKEEILKRYGYHYERN